MKAGLKHSMVPQPVQSLRSQALSMIKECSKVKLLTELPASLRALRGIYHFLARLLRYFVELLFAELGTSSNQNN